jgi:hypothetical protein
MFTEEMIDKALDRSVVLGYANIGLEVRRRLSGWPAGPARMDGKVVLVTGAGSGYRAGRRGRLRPARRG